MACDNRAGGSIAGENLEHAGGESSFFDQAAKCEGAEGRLFRGFENEAVSGREGGRGFEANGADGSVPDRVVRELVPVLC
jgi:hypothetical protein